MSESIGYKKRTRAGFSTNAKGKAQLDITVEIMDLEDKEEITVMLGDAVKSVKEVLYKNGIDLAE